MSDSLKKLLIAMLLIGLLMFGYNAVKTQQDQKSQLEYSEFINQVHEQKIDNVVIEGSLMYGFTVKGQRKDQTKFFSNAPYDMNLVNTLIDNNVRVKVVPEEKPSFLTNLLISLIPLAIIILVFLYFMRRMQGGGGKGGAFSFGKSPARLLDKDSHQVTFADVAGCDEAKEEVQEIVDYLREPTRYQNLGGKVPHGVLMVGSPGTGKTLLAKAIAGEAKVPFFSISGSDFVEMFVGVGASRVRDMFEQAKKQSPCIIFIDEIDAVGRQRGAGVGGGNDEREQTLNQLLVEMDGIGTNATVIVIAATNRPDVLDPALLRPGRFDRQVVVPMPDIRGREQILAVHVKNVKTDDSVNVSDLARGTPGFSGADLANLVNEAALLAGRRKKAIIDQSDFEEAKDKIYMGPERRSMVMHEDEKRATAYHETGHAVVAASLPGTDPVHKVTIMPRGRALGLTWQLPERDSFSKYKDQMLNEIAILFAGRIAEEIFVKRVSTGASNDFERATKMARDMVMRFGMSDKMGVMVYSENQDEVFLGRSVTQSQNISESTMKQVDKEVRRILDEQYMVARKILEEKREIVETMTESLMKWETIDADQVAEIMQGKQPSEPKDYSHNLVANQPESKNTAETSASDATDKTQTESNDAVKASIEPSVSETPDNKEETEVKPTEDKDAGGSDEKNHAADKEAEK